MKLEIFIFILQISSLIIYATTLFESDLKPGKLLDSDITEKFWQIRGQALVWRDSLFLDCLTIVVILFYLMGLTTFAKSIESLFYSIE